MQELNAKSMGYSIALLSALYMLLLGILGNFGVYLGAVEMMQKWHLFFSLSLTGIITGIIEAAVHGFIAGYLLAYLYNKFI